MRAERDVPNDDAILVAHLRDGTDAEARDALDAIYHLYFLPLWRFVRQIISNDDGAKDVVHDVFLAVWSGRSRLAIAESLRTYLYRAVRNRALNAVRHNAFTDRDADPAQIEARPADQTLELTDLERTIALTVDALPERQRAALLLFWHQEMSMSDVARVLEISPTASRKLILAAQARIRQAIGDYLV